VFPAGFRKKIEKRRKMSGMDKRDSARSGRFPPMETILRRPARPSLVVPRRPLRAPRLLLPLLAALLPAAPPLPLAGQGAWELDPEETFPPAREYHTMTQSGSKIYLFGGKDAAGNALNDLWA